MKGLLCLLLGLGLIACDRSGKTSTKTVIGPKGGLPGKGYQAQTVLQIMDEAGGGPAAVERHAALAVGASVLERAVENLGLAARWELEDSAAAVDLLQDQVASKVIRGTDLIEIVVERPDRTEAAEIANAIAAAFQEKTVEMDTRLREERIKALERQIEEQKDKLDESRVRLLEIMEEAGIDEHAAAPAWLRPQPDELAEMRTKLLALRDLSGDALVEAAVNLDLDNPTLTLRYPEYQQVKVQRMAMLESGLGSRHPSVVQLQTREEQLMALLIEAVDLVKGRLETRLEAAEKALEDAGADAEKERDFTLEYTEAKMDYELAREGLTATQIDFSSLTAAPSRPKLVIHELAR